MFFCFSRQLTTGNRFGFTGQRFDPETGLWDFRNRAYSAELGRFLQRDPAGFVDGYNTYLYCRNSPMNFVDPDGRIPRKVAAGVNQFMDDTADLQQASWGPNPVYVPTNWTGYLWTGVANTPIMFNNTVDAVALQYARAAGEFASDWLMDQGVTDVPLSEGLNQAAFVLGANPVQAGLLFESIAETLRYGKTALGALGESRTGYAVGEIMPNGQVAGIGPGAMLAGEPTLAARTPAFESMLQKVETLDFSTPRNGAVFYSGPGQGARAGAFAERTGGMTIEMTPGGKALASDPVFQSLSPTEQYQVWQKASTPFARGASGRVNAFIQGARPTGTFRTIEEPIIRESIEVNKTTYHY